MRFGFSGISRIRRMWCGVLWLRLSGKYRKLSFCYEAGPTGYGLYRQIRDLGHDCSVIAPSLIPKRPGERVKTNRRDALTLARLHRAGELTAIWVPDPDHEAIRDVVRAREAAMEDLRAKRQHLQSFLLRHGRRYPGLRSCIPASSWFASVVIVAKVCSHSPSGDFHASQMPPKATGSSSTRATANGVLPSGSSRHS